MSERKILPCPFCGEKAKTFHIPENDEEEMKNHPKWKWKHPGMRVIGCDTYYMCMGDINHYAMIFETEEDAIKTWNTRKSVENVVEQLGNVAFERYNTDGMGGEKVVNLDDAIEIVKQGGIGTDDVCEWKYPKEIMDNTEFEVSCNSRPLKRGIVPNNFSFYDFKYCPYCGKKIKVVE